ncbi:MAG: 4-(cytidine 5'-diphospho)-2-C-methyl-D-erythritol kinase [Clostridiales bacterium]|jgi:4-diphosphocytidyl-2-C-methyl-D-erythritol kinase|nr:4-(cytidine 5'-diphospho)-2-C-methyl-D-erythritol kinase [Clostridiales bacterium]
MIENYNSKIKVYAPAKINLTLEILNKLKNNFHEILSVMQTVNLFDEIEFEVLKNENKIIITSNCDELKADDRNLVYRISKDFLKEFKINFGLRINILKKIPIGAGLAGGSSDCAATLKTLIKLFDINLDNKKIAEICFRYGSDVLFCFFGGTIIASGTGNILQKINTHPEINILLITPDIFISTKDIYNLYDEQKKKEIIFNKRKLYSHELTKAIEEKNMFKIANNLKNDFEEIVFKIYPEIKKIKKLLISNGALGASLSGTGSSVFGYFIDKNDAIKAKEKIKSLFLNSKNFVLKIFNP